MVDTCDPTVACWSEDGETFVVKDPIRFEKQIIPQFFKHSKFSSFVRVSKKVGSKPITVHGVLIIFFSFIHDSQTVKSFETGSNLTFMPLGKSSTLILSGSTQNWKQRRPITGDSVTKASVAAIQNSWGISSE